MDIYIKPLKKAKIVGRKLVYLRDVAEVFAPNATTDLENLAVFRISGDQKASYLISSMDLVKAITEKIENAAVNNLGEMDVVVEYRPKPEKKSRIKDYCKVAVVAIILFAGSATAIMSFNSDAQIAQVFEKYYEIFFGQASGGRPYLLEIPYAVGLAVGITVFFNHFSKAHLTEDPTPIEVEMTTYEQQAIASVTDSLERQKKEQKGNKP